MRSEVNNLLTNVARALAIEDGLQTGDTLLVHRFWKWFDNYQTTESAPTEHPVLLTPRGAVKDEYVWWDMGTSIFGMNSQSGTSWRVPHLGLALMPQIPLGEEIIHSGPEEPLPWAEGIEAESGHPSRHLHIVGPIDG